MSEDAPTLEHWISAVRETLAIPESVNLDVADVLDLARLAAHGVTRPAAPLTTFLAGFAAGRAGGSQADIDAAMRAVLALAESELQPRR